MTVTNIRFNPTVVLRGGDAGAWDSKPGLLPTPHPYTLMAPPVPPSMANIGVVCLDRALVDTGKKSVLVPKLVRVRHDMVRGCLKNSFLEFEKVNVSGIKSRRMSCPPDVTRESQEQVARIPAPSAPPRGVTTFMIRNIPTRFTSLSFVRLLEDYGFGGSFNFFYLPMDFRSGKNMGYAFINFLEPHTGTRFVEKFHARRLPMTTSKKVMEISPSRRQGLVENIALFRTSDLLNSASLPHYKPLIATKETGGELVPLTEHNFPAVVH
jgi:hypothetical protein